MEVQLLRKSEFREMAKSIGVETRVVVRDGDEWFEQLTDGDVVVHPGSIARCTREDGAFRGLPSHPFEAAR